MSRTYRRRNPSRKNNTNFPASRYYTDFQIIEDEDIRLFLCVIIYIFTIKKPLCFLL